MTIMLIKFILKEFRFSNLYLARVSVSKIKSISTGTFESFDHHLDFLYLYHLASPASVSSDRFSSFL